MGRYLMASIIIFFTKIVIAPKALYLLISKSL